jgi:PilZ domain
MYYGRRWHQRRAAFPLGSSTLGKIFIGEAFFRICKLADISDSGACIQVDRSDDVPETFNLVLDFRAVKKACRIIWRDADRIGIAFDCAAHAEAEQGILSARAPM